jgi:uncharacterized tellurite resistance protein B-like protein
MHEQDKAILQSLVSVAWADGTFADREREMLDALIQSFGATEAEAAELREYAKTRRSLEDIPITELSAADRRLLLQHAVVLSWVDGEQHEDERVFIEGLRERLRISPEEAGPLVETASERARRLLGLLQE